MPPDLEIYDGQIFVFHNLIKDPDKLVRLIELSDKKLTDEDCIGKWIEWTADDYKFGYRKEVNSSKSNTSQEDAYNIYNTINNAIWHCLENYEMTVGQEVGIRSPFGIAKYDTGSFMGKHVDDYSDPDKIPTISAILYLNDDYQGGELYFEEQGIKINPTAGSMVIFPSTKPYFHESLQIIDGTKYMCPIFCYKDKVL